MKRLWLLLNIAAFFNFVLVLWGLCQLWTAIADGDREGIIVLGFFSALCITNTLACVQAGEQ